MAFLFDPLSQVEDANGLPMVGAALTFYRAGTTTKITIYQDSQATTPHTNPVLSDSAGMFPSVFLSTTDKFKYTLETAGGITVKTVDGVPPLNLDAETLQDAVDQAEAYRDQAAASAAGLNIPPIVAGDAGKILQAKSDLSGSEWVEHYISAQITKTVGVGKDFTTLQAAMDWALGVHISGADPSLRLLLDAGDFTVNSYAFDHPNADRITIEGAALTGGVALRASNLIRGSVTNPATLVSARTADEATVRARWATRILVSGASVGLSLPRGLRLVKNVAIISTARYTVTVGNFISNYLEAGGNGASIAWESCCIIGGVWGILLSGAYMTNRDTLLLCYQGKDGVGNQGGPIIALHGSFVQNDGGAYAHILSMYGTIYTGQGLHIQDSTIHTVNNIEFYGRMQVGALFFYAQGDLATAVFDGLQAGVYLTYNSYVNLNDAAFINCDATASDAQLVIAQGNSGPIRALIGIGIGSSAAFYNAQFNGCVANYLLYGETANKAYAQSVDIDNCKWITDTVRLEGDAFGRLTFVLTNPQSGSLDTFRAQNGGRIDRRGSAGPFTVSPTLGTQDATWSSVV